MTDTRDHLHRYYTREEEFLDEYGFAVGAAVQLLGDLWHPDDDCDDAVRRQRRYFISSGELTALVFDGAAVYHRADSAFSSVQIALKSATRVVTVRVRRGGERLVADKIVDRPLV